MTRLTSQPFISLVVPAYNEADNIDAFFERVLPVLEHIGEPWEILFIDDGSTDDTAQLIAQYHQHDARIKLVSFSRNFGKEVALTAGLDHAAGQVVVPLDADLQDPPELIPDMIEKWREGFEVVLATRRQRAEDSLAKRVTAEWFYRILHKLSSVHIPKNTGDFRLMDRCVVEAVRQLPERSRFMKGVLAWVGYRTTQIFYDRPQRHRGETKFRFRNLWRLALDGIFSFTTLPLKIWTYLGAFISLLAFGYAAVLIVRAMLFGVDVPGYTSLMVVMLFLGGIQLISLGIIGEYVGRIFRETKRRPIYLIRESFGVTPSTRDT